MGARQEVFLLFSFWADITARDEAPFCFRRANFLAFYSALLFLLSRLTIMDVSYARTEKLRRAPTLSAWSSWARKVAVTLPGLVRFFFCFFLRRGGSETRDPKLQNTRGSRMQKPRRVTTTTSKHLPACGPPGPPREARPASAPRPAPAHRVEPKAPSSTSKVPAEKRPWRRKTPLGCGLLESVSCDLESVSRDCAL